MYILSPHAAGILYAPPLYTPPTPRRVFSRVGGWGCIKIGPVRKLPTVSKKAASFSGCFQGVFAYGYAISGHALWTLPI